jgi:hypothetical protein
VFSFSDLKGIKRFFSVVPSEGMQSHDAKPRKNEVPVHEIKGKRKPSSKSASVTAKRPAKERKRAKKAKPSKKRCRFEDSMAEHSGDGTDGGEGDESSEEETAEDKKFIDDNEPADMEIEKLPRISAEEKVVSEDELENLKDTVMELCSKQGGKAKPRRAYADPSDEEKATASDLEFLSESSGDEDLKRTERRAKQVLDSFVKERGITLRAGARDSDRCEQAKKKAVSVSLLSAEAHKNARKKAYENTMSFLRSRAGSNAPVGSVGCIRPYNGNRKLAPIFTGSSRKDKDKVNTTVKCAKGVPGLVVKGDSKEVYYRHKDGRLSPRPGAL